MSITRFNKSSVYFKFKAGDDFEYKTLEDLYTRDGLGVQYKVNGLYINKGLYGQEPLIVSNHCFINLPSHLTSEIQEIRADENLVQDINDGKIYIEIYEYYQTKFKKKCYSINWKETENEDEKPF